MKIKGYLNSVELKNKYSKRFAHSENFCNEILVYKKLGIPFETNDFKLTRDIFKGNIVVKWNQEKIKSLQKAIKDFHGLNSEGFKEFNWSRYDSHIRVLSNEQIQKYDYIRNKINKNIVPSHNDINGHNVLWDGNSIKLIDFEWSSLNHPYFDYINIYIHEDIIILEDYDKREWNNLLFITLCYFLMWAEEYSNSDYVQKLKKRYKNLLNKIETNNM